MEPNGDYYTILGIAANASLDEIQNAYRRLARLYHPDLNGGNAAFAERMTAINAARDILSDPVHHAEYDSRLAASTRMKPWLRRRALKPGSLAAYWHTVRTRLLVPAFGPLFASSHRRARHHARHSKWTETGWMGWMAMVVVCFAICGFGVSDAISARSNAGAEATPFSIKKAPTIDPSLALDPHPEICQTFQQYPDVFWAESDADGDAITITMNPKTKYPNRIVVAWRVDATMNERIHQGVRDRLESIRIVSNQGTEEPITLSPRRGSWRIHVPGRH